MKKVSLDLIAFAALTVAVLLGFFVSPQDLPKQSFCLFQRATGFDCPGCGLTRAFLLIPQGHWREAWAYHPAAFFIYALFLFWIIKIIFQNVKRWPDQAKIAKVTEIVLITTSLIVLLGQWILKGVHYVIGSGNI